MKLAVTVYTTTDNSYELNAKEIPVVKDGFLTIVDQEDDDKVTVFNMDNVVCFDYVEVEE